MYLRQLTDTRSSGRWMHTLAHVIFNFPFWHNHPNLREALDLLQIHSIEDYKCACEELPLYQRTIP